jgi:hypothetical protein
VQQDWWWYDDGIIQVGYDAEGAVVWKRIASVNVEPIKWWQRLFRFLV